MKAPMILAGIVSAVILFMFIKRRRRKPKGAVARVRQGVEQAMSEAETRSKELRKRASKMKGEARQRLHDRASDLDAKQKDLRSRLDQLSEDAKKVVEHARS
jgi:flagellar biosynthesis/type III secretory pathway M-ring protein FliF/YscJ